MNIIESIDKYLGELYSLKFHHHLSDKVHDKDFINVFVVNNPSKHSMMGNDPKVLYVNLEPYNKELTPQYENMLYKKLKSKKEEILKAYSGKEIIIVNDRVKI